MQPKLPKTILRKKSKRNESVVKNNTTKKTSGPELQMNILK